MNRPLLQGTRKERRGCCATPSNCRGTLQGYLAHKKPTPPLSEVPLYLCGMVAGHAQRAARLLRDALEVHAVDVALQVATLHQWSNLTSLETLNPWSHRFRAKRNMLKRVKGLLPESQWRVLALDCLIYSLDSGPL